MTTEASQRFTSTNAPQGTAARSAGESSDLERARLVRLLDETHTILVDERNIPVASKAVEDLVIGLFEIQRRCDQETWVHDLARECGSHPIAAVLQQDPYTSRALRKPRGFAGDAVMLDFLYDSSPGPGVSELGAEIFRATALTSSGRSVVERRELLAERISAIALEKAQPRILSIACGHARELELVDDDVQRSIGEFLALDQDSAALTKIETSEYTAAPRVICASVRDLIAGRVDLAGGVDFAYAAGLLDYLSDNVSKRLIRKICEVLAPGGRLLVGNFTPQNWGRAYMDAFMEWHLTYRTSQDLRALGRNAGIARRIAVERVFEDQLGNVAYLELVVA